MKTMLRLFAILLMGCCTLASAQLVINEDRAFTADATTEITVDDEPMSLADFRADGNGYVADYVVDSDVTDDINAGWLRGVYLRSNLIGPVTSRDPLTVMGLPVIVTDDTVLRNIPSDDPDVLPYGSVVLVSGFPAADSTVLASRIALKESGASFWRISGYVSSVGADGISIGEQRVAVPGDIGTGHCEVRDFALVRMAPNPGYELGDTLENVSQLRCGESPFPPNGLIPAAIEGFVTAIIDDLTFLMGRVTINTTEDTVYINGDASDLKEGIKLEAQGPLQLLTKELTARRIKFKEVRIEALAPLTPDNYRPGESLTVLGITFLLTDQTRDEMRDSDLGDGRQVRVRGFMDAGGQVFASRVRNVGEPDFEDVGLRGVVGDVSQPTFNVSTATIDTTDSELVVRNMEVREETFFELLKAGTFVQVSDASYDSSANQIFGGTVEVKGRRGNDFDIPRPVARVVARGPVGRDDIDPRKSVTVLGLKFQLAPGTRDDDDINKGEIPDLRQIEVEGLLFGDNRLIALHIKRLGAADYEDVKLLGPITRLQRPNFAIQDVSVDSSDSEFLLPGGPTQFFNEADLGQLALVDHATWNAQTGLITEGVIDIRIEDDPFVGVLRRRVRALGPAGPDAIGPGASSITVLGVEFQATPLTEDPEGLLTGSLTDEMQLEVRGSLVYPEGLLLATRVRSRGAPNAENVELRGPAGVETPPTFDVLSTTVDTTGARLISHRTDEPLTPEKFFAALDPRDPIYVQKATWDENAGIISGGKIELPVFDEDGKVRVEPKAGYPFGVGTGTVSNADAGLIFNASFDND